jgi:hypothetical protein
MLQLCGRSGIYIWNFGQKVSKEKTNWETSAPIRDIKMGLKDTEYTDAE